MLQTFRAMSSLSKQVNGKKDHVLDQYKHPVLREKDIVKHSYLSKWISLSWIAIN